MRSQRQRVVARVKLRRRRLKRSLKLGLALWLAIGAWQAKEHLLPRWLASPWWKDHRPWKIREISVVGVPASVQELLMRELPLRRGASLLEVRPTALERSLRERFAWLGRAELQRDFLKGRVQVRVYPRRPVARVFLGGGEQLFLDEGGETAPVHSFVSAGLAFPGDLPELRVASSAADFVGVAHFLDWLHTSSAFGFLPSPIQRLSLEPPGELTLSLKDGEKILWGNLSAGLWEQKLRRLRQVTEDAARRFGGFRSASLRYFEEGKIHVVPHLR